MLQTIEQIVVFLLILSILVVVHEWGHFIVARLFGIRVDDFSIGFGKRLIRLGKRGDTEYNIRLLPLGGFVKIAGMEADEEPINRVKEKVLGKPATDDPDANEAPLLAENTPEDVAYTGPDGFNSKPLWQRSLVILAGPVMSFVLGYVVFCLMGVTTGLPIGTATNQVAMVQPGGEGQRIGLRSGDVITAINGQSVSQGDQMVYTIHHSLNKQLVLTIQRGQKAITLKGTPRVLKDDSGQPIRTITVTNPGVIGQSLGLQPNDVIVGINDTDIATPEDARQAFLKSAGKAVKVDVQRETGAATLHASLPKDITNSLPTLEATEISGLEFEPSPRVKRVSFVTSVKDGTIQTLGYFQQLGSMFRQPKELRKNAGGIVGIYQVTGLAVRNGIVSILMMMAELSLSLAVFNLLPIPVLDGGHLLAFFIEWVRRGKKMTEAQQQAFLMAGLAIIGVLFVLVMSNDILRTIHHQLPQ